MDIHSFKTDIKKSIQPGPSESELSVLTDHYNKELVSILDKHATTRTKLVTIRPKHPWFSDEFYDAKCEKRKCERCWRRTGLSIHYDLLRSAMTQYNNMLNSAKEKYYNNLITESSTDSKSLHRILKEILNQRDDLKRPKHSSDAELANRFANFFADKTGKICTNLPDLSHVKLEIPSTPVESSLACFSLATED